MTYLPVWEGKWGNVKLKSSISALPTVVYKISFEWLCISTVVYRISFNCSDCVFLHYLLQYIRYLLIVVTVYFCPTYCGKLDIFGLQWLCLHPWTLDQQSLAVSESGCPGSFGDLAGLYLRGTRRDCHHERGPGTKGQGWQKRWVNVTLQATILTLQF